MKSTASSIVAFVAILCSTSAFAKPTAADVAKAQASATMELAGVKLSRLAIAEDAGLANNKDALSAIYDRQEAAVKSGVAQLAAAGGDPTQTTAGIAAISAAGNEATKYLQANPGAKDKITRRLTIIRAEIDKICHTPASYIAAIAKAGLAGAPLAQATTAVQAASQKAAGQSDGDAGDAIQSARSQVRSLLTPAQATALDSQLAGK